MSKFETNHQSAPLKALDPLDVLVACDAIRDATTGIDTAADVLLKLMPTHDAKGDIDLAGRRVAWLCGMIEKHVADLYREYSDLMEKLGCKPDNSGVYKP